MSSKPETWPDRRFKTLFRFLDYIAHKSELPAKAAQCERKAKALSFAERWQFKRRLFWKYGGAFCLYCGRSMPLDRLTIDHIQPRSKGGPVRDVNNMVLACLGCNRKKGNKWETYTTKL